MEHGVIPSPMAPAWKRSRIRFAVAWLRANLFSGWISSLITVVLAGMLIWILGRLIDWAVIHATFVGTSASACTGQDRSGACWVVIPNEWRLMTFGLYPYDEQWRPAIALVLLVGLYISTGFRRLWSIALLVAWIVGLASVGILMWGGIFHLKYVSTDAWGGLPVTLLLATFGLSLAFPFGVALAVARTSRRAPALRALATVYIEVIRSLPMVTVLFMASLMFPLLLPEGLNISMLLRVLIAIIMFVTAYLAEVVRGGLQALPKGQAEAAAALGLSPWEALLLVLLPQALRSVIPAIVNTFIGFFKATSIVSIVGIFDLLTAGEHAAADPAWQQAVTEIYVFIALIYFCFCFAMSRYSRRLERGLERANGR